MTKKWYTDTDLNRLNSLDTLALHEALDKRLSPKSPERLTHKNLCRFREALLQDPKAQTSFEVQFPGLAAKIQAYMDLPATRRLLQAQLNISQDLEGAISNHHKILKGAEHGGLPGKKPDAVTGAICDDCAPCLTCLYEHGAIFGGSVSYNEHGFALLSVAIKAGALSTVAPLISNSGLDPGPFQPYRVLRSGAKDMSLFRLYAIETSKKEFFHAMMQWCDRFIAQGEPRIAKELDSSAQYGICKMGCIKIADWVLEMDLNIGAVVREKDGKCSWHGAVFKEHPALFSWLSDDPSTLALINRRDKQGRTPLMYAVELDKEVSVSWLLYRMRHDQIRSGDLFNGYKDTALEIALLRHSEKSVQNFQRIWKSDAYYKARKNAEITTLLCDSIVTDLIKCRAKLEKSGISRRQRDDEWDILKRIAKRKCQVLVKDSPANIYRGNKHRECVMRARENDLEFLVLSLIDERLMSLWDDEVRKHFMQTHFKKRK